MDAVLALLAGAGLRAAQDAGFRSALPYIVPITGILAWNFSNPAGIRHKIEHYMGWNLAGHVMSYMGEDKHVHHGLFCEKCGVLFDADKPRPISSRLGEAMVQDEASFLLSRIAYHDRRTNLRSLEIDHALNRAAPNFSALVSRADK